MMSACCGGEQSMVALRTRAVSRPSGLRVNHGNPPM